MQSRHYIVFVSLTVALGGFLMGFDASVISGVTGFLEAEYALSSIETGWIVASLTLTAAIAMLVAGPLSNVYGRRTVLRIASLLFLLSALGCAVAPNFILLVIARMVGGLGVGAALIIAPMYIAEMAPARHRGRLVSFNQLNIVVGISVAYFSNYLLQQISQMPDTGTGDIIDPGNVWRWMLGVEAIPALLYLLVLGLVPESPRWLMMKGREADASKILIRVNGEHQAMVESRSIRISLAGDTNKADYSFKVLLQPSLRLVLWIGIAVAVLQQITGINAVFFYAPMIFEQTGIGTDASFLQAVLVGLVNLVFTVIAILTIDRIGRKPLLQFGVSGIAFFMFLLAFSFGQATYKLNQASLDLLPDGVDHAALAELIDTEFGDEQAFRQAVRPALGEAFAEHEAMLLKGSIDINSTIVLAGILGFVACFAVSLGPVMWVLFSELFPNHVRGVAISLVGLINSGVSFLVQLVFPWELANLGSGVTFLIYGLFALAGLVIVSKMVPETMGKSLEELEAQLVGVKS